MKNKVFLYIFAFIIVILVVSNFSFFNSKLCLKKNNGDLFEAEDVRGSKILFVYFSVNCGECETVLSEINKKLNSKKSNLFFVIDKHQMNGLKSFLANNKLENINDMILMDESFSMQNFFELGFEISYPTLCVYDKSNDKKEIEYNVEKFLSLRE